MSSSETMGLPDIHFWANTSFGVSQILVYYQVGMHTAEVGTGASNNTARQRVPHL